MDRAERERELFEGINNTPPIAALMKVLQELRVDPTLRDHIMKRYKAAYISDALQEIIQTFLK